MGFERMNPEMVSEILNQVLRDAAVEKILQ